MASTDERLDPAGEAPSDPTDEALMLEARGGSAPAFETIVRRRHRDLMNYFVRMGVSTHEAEDMTQDTFVRLFRYRDRYAPRAQLRTFLFVMARQVWIDRWRRRANRERREDAARSDAEAGDSFSTATDAAAARAEEALRRLPEPMREVVSLCFYGGLRYGEIAEVLGVAEGTVKSRMFHALRKLREEMR